MTVAEDKKRGVLYIDWRRGFMDLPSIIMLCESEHTQPGKEFIYFYPYSDEDQTLLKDDNVIAIEPSSFHTSPGITTKSGNHIFFDTAHSRYTFEEGDFGLNDSDKELLKFCAGVETNPESTN